MVHARHRLDDVVLTLTHVDETRTVVEVFVVALAGHRSDAVNRAFQTVVGDLREVGNALQIRAGRHDALLGEGIVFRRVFFDSIRYCADLIVPKHPAVAASLIENGFGEHVAAAELFNEALAFLIQHDGAVKAGIRDQFNHARDRVADRIGLDVLHVDEFCARTLSHIEGLARGARSVRGLKAFVNLRVVLFHHRGVSAKAARSQHHAALGVERVFGAVHRRLDAYNAAALIFDKLLGLHIGDDRDPEFIGLRLELRDEFCAGVAHRNQRALAAVTAEEEEIVRFKTNAQIVAAPFRAGQGVVSHHIDDLHVALLVAAQIRILGMKLRRVVRDAELRLHPVLGGIHFRAGNERVAAHLRHLFEEHYSGAGVLGFNGSRTNHYDVIGSILRQILDRSFESLFIGLTECDTCFLSRIFNSCE